MPLEKVLTYLIFARNAEFCCSVASAVQYCCMLSYDIVFPLIETEVGY